MNDTDKRIVGFLLSFFMAHVEAYHEDERLRRLAAKLDQQYLTSRERLATNQQDESCKTNGGP